ncbi:hypothetical protein [Streptomyces sp. MK37H]|uniref:hypothetical protein n=1 Tax=Streptomyces sp. MK37H TaxID=2699117 RepID=UPI001B3639CC|nr:hypothetical protein [Streptomyces sp. MK37H]MBP8536110.1 hypothetical protein [Streptomyces sp. MK37H]
MSLSTAEIAKRFAPIAIDPERLALKDEISTAAREFAELLRRRVPYSRELQTAIEAVEAAVDAAHNGVDRRYVTRGERQPAPAAGHNGQPPTAAPGRS